MRDSGSWNFPIQSSQRVNVDNIKIFGWRGNSDGVDINNSSDVNVSGCFFRTFDDNVVIKSSTLTGAESRDIHVTRCVHWNEIAHPLSLGAELNANCENVTFSDCDIIHDKGREWDLRVYNAGAADVKNVVFDNIRIEEARRVFSVWIGKTIWVNSANGGMSRTSSSVTLRAPSLSMADRAPNSSASTPTMRSTGSNSTTSRSAASR